MLNQLRPDTFHAVVVAVGCRRCWTSCVHAYVFNDDDDDDNNKRPTDEELFHFFLFFFLLFSHSFSVCCMCVGLCFVCLLACLLSSSRRSYLICLSLMPFNALRLRQMYTCCCCCCRHRRPRRLCHVISIPTIHTHTYRAVVEGPTPKPNANKRRLFIADTRRMLSPSFDALAKGNAN